MRGIVPLPVSVSQKSSSEESKERYNCGNRRGIKFRIDEL